MRKKRRLGICIEWQTRERCRLRRGRERMQGMVARGGRKQDGRVKAKLSHVISVINKLPLKVRGVRFRLIQHYKTF